MNDQFIQGVIFDWNRIDNDSYLKEIGYSDIQLYHNITDTVNKSLDERKKLFTSSIYFRNANDKKNISDDVKKEMSELLDKLLLKFLPSVLTT